MFDIVSLETYGMLLLSLRRSTFFHFVSVYVLTYEIIRILILTHMFLFFALWVFLNNRNSYRVLRLFFSLFSSKIILHVRKNMYIFPVFLIILQFCN